MDLILSRQIAEAHGGVLQLANRADRTGCEAVLALPITYDGAGGWGIFTAETRRRGKSGEVLPRIDADKRGSG
jgi:hypothetical protein